MMRRRMVGVMCGLEILAMASVMNAQTLYASGYPNRDGQDRAYLLKLKPDMLALQSDWSEGKQLRAYADAHAGRYLLFLANGKLYRLDSPEKLAELDRMYAPMRALAAEQEALAAQQQALAAKQQPLAEQQRALAEQQQPLSEQQQALSAKMRASVNGASLQPVAAEQGVVGHEQSVVGRVQGAIGYEQGTIGRAQGEIGRQQGTLGQQQGVEAKALYSKIEWMMDDCLKQHTCAVVAEATTAK